jgi:hypothetical protein
VFHNGLGLTSDASLGNSARFWMNLQAAHDTWEAEANPEIQKITRLAQVAKGENECSVAPAGRDAGIVEPYSNAMFAI